MAQVTLNPAADTAHRKGLAFVFFAGVLWSTVGLGIRLIEDAGVWQILLYRSAALSAFLFAVLKLRNGGNPLDHVRRAGLPGVIAALALVAAYSGAITAIQETSVANAMLLFASAPFLAAILGRVVLGEAVRRATWAAMAVPLAGIAVMVADKTGAGALRGNLAGLGSALGFAVFTVALRWGKSTEMLPAVFLSGLFGVAITATICIATGTALIVSAPDAGVAIAMGVLQVGAGLVLYTLGSRTVPAAELALLSMAEVLLGPVWVWLFLGETASANTVLGGAILLAAIAANALSGIRRKPPVTLP